MHEALGEDLGRYSGRGTLRFTVEEAIPASLVEPDRDGARRGALMACTIVIGLVVLIPVGVATAFVASGHLDLGWGVMGAVAGAFGLLALLSGTDLTTLLSAPPGGAEEKGLALLAAVGEACGALGTAFGLGLGVAIGMAVGEHFKPK